MKVFRVDCGNRETLFIEGSSRGGVKIMARQLGEPGPYSVRTAGVEELAGLQWYTARFNDKPGDPNLLDLRSER